jgi:hypothetical protein
MSQSDCGSQRRRRAVRGLPVQEEIEFEEPVALILHFNLQNNDDSPTDEQMDDNTLVTQSINYNTYSWFVLNFF